jgi:transcriptional regulator with XRE-family HTH domain
MENSTKAALSERIRAERRDKGWTLDQFAEASGVSRAMISKIERGEVSPTAAILARLAAGLGTSLASLFSPPRSAEAHAGPALLDWESQQDWTDPESGYVRRNVSPPGSAADVVYVTFPAGARVAFDNDRRSEGIEQQVWILEGAMDLTIGGRTTSLSVGDCLRMRLEEPLVFHNPGEADARYIVVLARTAD